MKSAMRDLKISRKEISRELIYSKLIEESNFLQSFLPSCVSFPVRQLSSPRDVVGLLVDSGMYQPNLMARCTVVPNLMRRMTLAHARTVINKVRYTSKKSCR